MNSDNGTHFGGANRQLVKLVADKLDENKIRATTADKEVQWHFNPPLTPHFGGAHGSKIKASKRAIYGIFGNTDVTDEELYGLHWCRGPDKLTTFNTSVSESGR